MVSINFESVSSIYHKMVSDNPYNFKTLITILSDIIEIRLGTQVSKKELDFKLSTFSANFLINFASDSDKMDIKEWIDLADTESEFCLRANALVEIGTLFYDYLISEIVNQLDYILESYNITDENIKLLKHDINNYKEFITTTKQEILLGN
jgi:hypothetical protein